ncbi:hypothetical protein [Mucilaginibacter sp. MD40]|uniref:hypothetical protein n=1 Tax=Mucilaginibacter sp. MD40 TaxID=2029590 RepID=UPI00117FF3E9|nr:hypothetical protein [Mucilaginibacter sp. MD40]
MKTIQLNLYHFSELNERAQKKALADNQDFNVNNNWWDWIYDDAEEAGLKITGFDLDRACYCNAQFIHDAIYTATQVRLNHGEKTETMQVTTAFWERRDHAVNTWRRDEIGEFENAEELDTTLDSIEEDYLKAMSLAYLRLLDKVYDELTSDEAIAESLTANEYWFTADGSTANRLDKLAEELTQQN